LKAFKIFSGPQICSHQGAKAPTTNARSKSDVFETSDFLKLGTVLDIFKFLGLTMLSSLKIIIEKHSDGYVAYPIGLKGVVVAEGETYEEALKEIASAIQFRIKTFGQEAFEQH
jgi:predicted RNase H-like HicB family nuclease